MVLALTEPGPGPDDAVAELVAALRAALSALAARSWQDASDEVLVETLTALQEVRAALGGVDAAVLAAVDRRDLARTSLGWGSTAEWYTHLAGCRRGAGRRAVEHARMLAGDRSATLEAMQAGQVSPEQAAVLLDAVDELPGDSDLRGRAEARLVEKAGHLTATDLERTAVGLVQELDPDGAARAAEQRKERLDRAAHHRRFLSITDDGAGGVRLRGRGTTEDAAVIRAALVPLTSPVGAVDPATGARVPDPRDHGARLWDALVRACQHSLDTELGPESHGARPRLSVVLPWDVLAPDGHASPADGGGPPGTGGRTEDGIDLTPGTVRRLACDADVVPVVLGSDGEVLDVGRQTRVVPVGLWRALVVRDGGCSFPGCSRPPLMCHAHHVVPWAEGGPTSLENLAMLCGAHHRLVHGSPWRIRLAPDGKPEFLPPPEPCDGVGSEADREDPTGPPDPTEPEGADRGDVVRDRSPWTRQRPRHPGALPPDPAAPRP